jgi:hypothetical protein
MKDWRSIFENTFFGYWQQAGLPAYTDYINEYIELRERGFQIIDWMGREETIGVGINNSQLQSVYGFGAVTCKIMGELLCVEASSIEKSADFCGRFNLGISIFDLIADELDGLRSLDELPVFASLQSGKMKQREADSTAEKLLTRLAGSVMKDLSSVSDPSLLHLLKKLFDAEQWVSSNKIFDQCDLEKMEEALYLKSAAPFELMAGYSIQIASPVEKGKIQLAHQLGKAIGYCYWLIDDATDISSDHIAGHWNWFLLQQAKEVPDYFINNRVAKTDSELINLLLEKGFIQIATKQVINQLIFVLKQISVKEDTKNKCIGMLGASLWQWWKF